ncbi:MAG: TetR/AcrR family transcriptional regulator [Acidimicrobiales bacterium]|jgi:AcrR family transcriptional regulator
MGIALADRALIPDRTAIGEADAAGFEPGVVASGTPPSPRAADSRARVLGAAVRCVARFGISKTTVDDVAREARLSRATLYRLFPGGRDEIVETMVAAEIGAYFGSLAARLEGVEDFEERIVVAMTAAAAELVGHRALGFVLAHEPELVLPHVSFAQFDRVLEVASRFFAPYLAGLLAPEDARRVGEWVTRLVLSHVACPADSLDEASSGTTASSISDSDGEPFSFHPEPMSPERARWLVRTFVMPGIRALTAASSSAGLQPTTQSPSAVTV